MRYKIDMSGAHLSIYDPRGPWEEYPLRPEVKAWLNEQCAKDGSRWASDIRFETIKGSKETSRHGDPWIRLRVPVIKFSHKKTAALFKLFWL